MSAGFLKALGVPLGDLLYPRTCCGCGEPGPEAFRYLCWDCWMTVQFMHPPMCSRCGDTVSGRVDRAFVCRSCSGPERFFDRARSAVRHEGAFREAIHAFKYSCGIWMAEDLACLLDACVDTHFDAGRIQLIVPVPLHPARRRKRGYNQASLLATKLARRLAKPCKTSVLLRIRDTDTQTRLTAEERLNNMRGAFLALRREAIQGKHILLVDDVMTSGATTDECARVLKEAEASTVEVVTVARG